MYVHPQVAAAPWVNIQFLGSSLTFMMVSGGALLVAAWPAAWPAGWLATVHAAR